MLLVGVNSGPRDLCGRINLCSGAPGGNYQRIAATADESWGWRRYFSPGREAHHHTEPQQRRAQLGYILCSLKPPWHSFGPSVNFPSVSLGFRFPHRLCRRTSRGMSIIPACRYEPYQAYAPQVGANRRETGRGSTRRTQWEEDKELVAPIRTLTA